MNELNDERWQDSKCRMFFHLIIAEYVRLTVIIMSIIKLTILIRLKQRKVMLEFRSRNFFKLNSVQRSKNGKKLVKICLSNII